MGSLSLSPILPITLRLAFISKSKPPLAAGPFGQGRVFDILALVTGEDVHFTLGFDLNFAVPENAIEQVICS